MERFETEEFIHAVQAREPIWLTTNPKHKHKKTVNKMWNEIADQFPEMSKLALKKKWKNLRDSFKRELKKNPTSRSRWSYFDLMKFISPYEIATATHSQATTEELPLLEMPSQTHIRYTNVVDDLVPTNDNVNSVGVNVGVVGVGDGTTTLTTLTNASNIHCSNNFNRQRKRKLRQDEISVVYETKVAKSDELEMLIDKNSLQPIHHHQQQQHQQHQQQQEQHQQLEDTNNALSSASMVEFMVEKNDDYHFFMSLLPQMSKFEMLQKLRIRQHIQQIIIDEACILQNGYTTG